MDLNDYNQWTNSTAIYPDAGKKTFNETLYLVLGLASEAGEVAGKLKKIVRGDKIDPETYVSELSDVLWYLSRAASAVGLSLEDLADYNYSKLESRKTAGTIQGEDQKDGSRITTNNT